VTSLSRIETHHGTAPHWKVLHRNNIDSRS
jgi:hypothetical protein